MDSTQDFLGVYTSYDGMITINLSKVVEEVDQSVFCNSEPMIIESLIDTMIHEELHKAIDENCKEILTNDQEERMFKLFRNWIERDKKTSMWDLA